MHSLPAVELIDASGSYAMFIWRLCLHTLPHSEGLTYLTITLVLSECEAPKSILPAACSPPVCLSLHKWETSYTHISHPSLSQGARPSACWPYRLPSLLRCQLCCFYVAGCFIPFWNQIWTLATLLSVPFSLYPVEQDWKQDSHKIVWLIQSLSGDLPWGWFVRRV